MNSVEGEVTFFAASAFRAGTTFERDGLVFDTQGIQEQTTCQGVQGARAWVCPTERRWLSPKLQILLQT